MPTLPDSLQERIHHFSRTQGAQTALIDEHGSLSYRQLQQRIVQLAEGLTARGCNHLGIWMDNGCDWMLAQLAAFQAGIPVTPIPPFFSPQQAAHALQGSGVDLLLCDDPQQARRIDGAFLEERRLQGLLPQRHLLYRRQAARPLPPGTSLVTFTSGTTGQPRGVCLGLAQLNTLCQSLHRQLAALEIGLHGCLMPLAVLLENLAGVLLPLYAGSTALIHSSAQTGIGGSSRLDPAGLVRYLNHHRPESLILSPQLLKVLVMLRASRQLRAEFRFIAVGGGKLSPTLLQQARALALPVYEGYGLSECASVVSLNTPAADRPGSVGKPLPHCRVAIAEDGEVLIKGSAMRGYLGDASGPDGDWVRSGDLGRIDEQGFLYLEGRKKHVFINSFGRNFSPEWIESELEACPAIAQACLFGDGQPFNVAVLTPAPGTRPELVEEQLQQLNRRLPDYARIATWLPSTAPFGPENGQLTSNGRIRRQAIYRAYGAALAQGYAQADDAIEQATPAASPSSI